MRSVPRTRGDGPRDVANRKKHRDRVPRTRGDGPEQLSAWLRSGAGVPRTRGDGPITACPSERMPRPCSPHTRGWTVSYTTYPDCRFRVPRTRGDGPLGRWNGSSGCPGVPRTRGDGPDNEEGVEITMSACSPHTRGWTGNQSGNSLSRNTCSPHTRGWTALAASREVPSGRVPRTRGDGPWMSAKQVIDQSGVPRTRGDGPGNDGGSTLSRNVFPAHAGMDRHQMLLPKDWIRCSPHTRGWTVRFLSEAERTFSVPCTRGDGPLGVRLQPNGPSVFPAHAGMDRD